MRTNPLKARLKAGKKCLGAWLAANSPVAAELFGQAGYDFVLIDHEHGPGDLMGALSQLHAVRSGGGANPPSPMVRVPWHDPVYVKRTLDIGMEGIVVPNVDTVEVARMMAEATLYPPLGMRGLAFGVTRHSMFGADAAEVWEKANREVVVFLQIETPKGIEAIPKMAEIAGFDGFFIGPNDLMSNAGENPLKPSPAFAKLLSKAEAAIKASGKKMASIVHSGLTVQQLFNDRGYDVICHASEISMLRLASAAAVAEHRKNYG
jgi:4-hydroxy-2-oxoheptanedioate aldolase